LRFKGYKVDEVADGGQAMERLTSSPSDLVLVSVNMPDMEGWEACRQLRTRSRVPILMISSLAPPFAWEEARDDGINAFIPKSADLGRVLSWVRGTGRRGRGGLSDLSATA
jgi:CheY-like chemotaxis protein